MFDILKLNQRMLSVVALRLGSIEKDSSTFDELILAAISGTLLSLIIPSILYSLRNFSELFKFVEAFYIFGIFSMFLSVYWSFAMGKLTIRDLLEAMQMIVEQSKDMVLIIKTDFHVSDRLIGIARNGQKKRYARTEDLMDWFTRRYYTVIMTMFATCFIVPLLVIAYTLISGQYSPDVLFLPYKMT